MKKAICQLVQCSADTLLLEMMNIQRQPNSHDCGLFALACATELVQQLDPTVCSWDVPNMKKYPLLVFEAGKIDGLACVKKR